MITELGLENFRLYSKLSNIVLKPLSIFCGVNSCGKSSILKSLALMKQSVTSEKNGAVICLNGEYVHLGRFKDIVLNHNTREEISLRFDMTVPDEYINEFKAIFFSKEKNILQKNNNGFFLKIDYKIKWDIGRATRYRHLPAIFIKEFRFSTYTILGNGNIYYGGSGHFKHTKSNTYIVNYENVQFRWHKWDKALKGENLKIRMNFENMLPEVSFDESRGNKIWPVIEICWATSRIIKHEFSKIEYIGPLRDQPSRKYVYDEDANKIGILGENAAYIYSKEKQNKVDRLYYCDSGTFTSRSINTIGRATSEWMTSMGAQDIDSENKEDVIGIDMSSSHLTTTRVSIADVGFGVSQIFPIVLEGIRMKSGSTLLLEQPEIHLHPNLQLRLADFLIATSISGRNIIVETHSDHLINRIVRRIVEDNDLRLKERIGVYFIQMGDSTPHLTEIEINSSLGIVNWPKGFCDQAASEQKAIIKAGLAKRMVN